VAVEGPDAASGNIGAMTDSLVVDSPGRTAAGVTAPDAVLGAAFAAQRAAFARDMNPSLAIRRDRLDRLLAFTTTRRDDIAAAIAADFGHRSLHETDFADIFAVLSAVRHTRRHLPQWMKARRVATPPHLWPATSEVIRQPLGVVGVISPWNYPLQLALLPAAAALAAGNRVMLKPSELTPRFSALLQSMVGASFAADEFAVFPGDVELGRAFSRLPFDHLFFTGSTAIGRQVALAAAENLTPVTLELGGKSPAIVDTDCDLTVAARRIAFAKLLNAGQTCVAPDYLLVPRTRVDDMISALGEAIGAMYPTLAGNPDYTSIASDRHYRRLARLVADAEVHGATVRPLVSTAADASARQFAPTVLVGVSDEMAVMREEIFGPILPIVPYDTLDEAIAYVNAHPRPLALYWFGHDRAHRQRVLEGTVSGGAATNDACWQVAQENMPFGGVGASGMGAYHGERGFLTFSKEKAVLHQARFNGVALFRPPYGRRFEALIALLKRFF
jgi:coniferyl-aldehyde dehydrogenase